MATVVRLTTPFRRRLVTLQGFAFSSLGREASRAVAGRAAAAADRRYSVAWTHAQVASRLYASVASPVTNVDEKPNNPATIHQLSSGSALADLLKQLDDQVRRWGRVDKEHVHRLLDLVSKNGSVSTQQSIMVLRCTGSLLVKESSSERNALFEKAKSVLQSVGAEVNVQVYNAMLRVKLENKQPFSPVEVLSELEMEKHLLPNRVTYQLLLSQFCEKGDIEGASTILGHMKSQNLPVNETIFNALVKGHVTKGDISGAKAVLATMSDSGMDPTADTYRTLICGLADKGDVAGVQESMKEAERASIKFFARHLYDVVVSLASTGQNEAIDEVLSRIKEKIPRHNQDALNCMFQLVAEGHDDIAYRVFNTMDHSRFQGQPGQSPCTTLMRIMIIKGRPVEKVLEIRNRLQTDNKFSVSLEEIAHLAFHYQHSGYALKVLEAMKKEGCEIKQHYFWPVLRDAAESRNVKGVMETVAGLVKCTRGTDDLVVGTIFRWAIKPLLLKGEPLETLVSGVRDAGLPEAEVEMLKIAGLLSLGKLEEVAKLINAGTKFSPAILKSELVNSFSQSTFNSAELVKVIQAAQNQLPSLFIDAQSGVLLGNLKTPSLSQATATKLITDWINADLKLFRNFEKPVKQELQRLGVASEVIQKMDSLFVDQVQEQISTEELKKASIEEMEQWLERSKGYRNPNLERTLLLKYGRAGMVEKADSLKRVLDQRGFIYGPDILRTLGTLAARDKKNLEEALTYKQQLEAEHPSFGSYAVLVLHIAKLQLKAKKFEEALNTVQGFSSLHLSNLQKSGASDGYINADLCRNLLVTCSEEFEPAKVQQLSDILCEKGFVKEDSYSLANQAMIAYIKKGDTDEILAVFEKYITKLNKAPQFSEVFRLLIEKEDADRLQKAVDLVATVNGEMSTLLHLVASFIECNKPRQARKVLETPGLRALMKPLIEACERFLMSDKEKELEQLVEYTKTLQGIDRDEMLLQLMRLYAKRKDTKKLMEVFSLYEEERVRPRPRTLRYVAKVLENQGLPAPFEIPSAEQVLEESSQPVASNALETEAQEAFKEKDVAKVMEIKMKMDAQGEELSSRFVTNVARFLLTRKDNQMFRRFTHQLAESGDTAGLLAIRKLALSKNLEQFVHQRLFLAYLYKNKIEELLDYLKENPEHLSKYLTMNGINLLKEKKPELMPSMVSIFEANYEKSGNAQITGILYNYYMINAETEELDNLLKKHPALKDRVRLSYVCQTARRLQKEDILQKVIEIHTCDNPRRLIVPFNQLLLLKCDQGNWVSALECYESALKSGITFEGLWVRSLQTLASLLTGNGQPLPWQPGMLEKRAASESSSARKPDASSSSSSSSDDESSSDSEKEEAKAIPKSHKIQNTKKPDAV